jgi:hypothetical protein
MAPDQPGGQAGNEGGGVQRDADREAVVGAVMAGRVKFKVRPPSPTGIEDAWLRRATAAAIEQARAVVSGGAAPPNTPVGRLSDVEWGWIVAGVLFGWISTRAEQATDSGVGVEESIRALNLDPDPWDAGAIAAILPELAASNVDWTKPLADLPRNDMIAFLADALSLVRKAMAARDRGQGLVTRRTPDVTAREALAAAGGSLMTPEELNDLIDV